MGKKGQFVPVFHLNTLGDLTGLLNTTAGSWISS